MRNIELSDETLGAYVDGELDATAVLQVETQLEQDAAARAQVAALRHISSLVRKVVQTPADAPVATPTVAPPPRDVRHDGPRLVQARTTALPSARRAAIVAPWRVAAAFAAGAFCTAIALWLLGAPAAPSSSWEDHALMFHQTYLEALQADRHLPLDASGSDPAALDASLAQLVDWNFAVPDLSAQGYMLQGARVIATAEGPLAYVLYSSAKDPLLGLAVLQRAGTLAQSGALHERGNLRLWEWSDGDHEFALGGSHSVESLRTLATAIAHAAKANAPARRV